MRVKWNGSLSGTFSASNGVKQGGVLSPLLFIVYLDQLILAPKELGIGCHLNGIFVGAFIYADDQWRSEGNWRPGANLNFAPPPSKKFFKMILKCIVFN